MTATKKTAPAKKAAAPRPPAKKRGPSFDPLRAARVDAFFRTHLKHLKGRFAGQPFILEDWQREHIINPIFGTVDPDGLRSFREGLVGLPRKNGKSELAAGIALYMLVADGEYGAEIYSVAGSRQQASIVFKTAVDMVKASPMLRAACKPYRSVIEVGETGSIYRVLSADANLAHGYNPHAAIIDELHVHPNSELYEAMRTGTAARSQPLVLSITTAGEAREGVCWDVYERGRSKEDKRMFFYWRGVPDGIRVVQERKVLPEARKALRDANPASWVTMDFLEDQARSLPPAVFGRLHANSWDEGNEQTWVTRSTVEACIGKPSIDPDLPVCIAVDAASRRDTTAVMAVQRDADGNFHRKCWHYTADESVGYFDYGVLENLIRDLAQTWDVRRLAFDPFQMVRTAQLLDGEGIPVEMFPQNDTRMVPATQLLYDLLVEQRLVIDNCPTCLEQISSAGVAESARGWRLHKKKSRAPIDAAVALAMAVQLAEWEHGDGSAPTAFVV